MESRGTEEYMLWNSVMIHGVSLLSYIYDILSQRMQYDIVV